MPSKPLEDQRGFIIPIGGREDKIASPTILEKFRKVSWW